MCLVAGGVKVALPTALYGGRHSASQQPRRSGNHNDSHPEYLKTHDGVYIAYQVVGHGPVDIAWQLDYIGNLDFWWEAPERTRFEGLSFSRTDPARSAWAGTLVTNVAIPNLETRAADLVRVLDEVGSRGLWWVAGSRA